MPVEQERLLRLIQTIEPKDLRNLLDASERVLNNRHPGSAGFQLGSVSVGLESDSGTTVIEKFVVPWEFVQALKKAVEHVLAQIPQSSDGCCIGTMVPSGPTTLAHEKTVN